MIRLDKYLADAGTGTRSEVKTYIKNGTVTVNSAVIRRPEHKVDPELDTVCYKDTPIRLSTYEYYILNKPAGYVSATKDNTAPTVLSLITSRRKDLFPVGRLDKDTEGLLLITNDGALAHRLLSPRHHVDKTYYAIVEGRVTDPDRTAFAQGLYIGDEDLDTALPANLIIEETRETDPVLSYIRITIQEGKFHQVKRMFQAVGKKVIYLKRITFGPLTLPADLEPGAFRALTPEEISLLRETL